MAKFGSLNRSAQQAYYNGLSQKPSVVIVHPPGSDPEPPTILSRTANDEVQLMAQSKSNAPAVRGHEGMSLNKHSDASLPSVPPRYPLQDPESGSHSEEGGATAVATVLASSSAPGPVAEPPAP